MDARTESMRHPAVIQLQVIKIRQDSFQANATGLPMLV